MKKIERLSEYYDIPQDKLEVLGVFDPTLGIDTLLFIDPLLLQKTTIPEFRSADEKVRKYFENIIILLRSKNEKARAKAIRKLTLREVKGAGIGYGKSKDDGSAIGPVLASRLASAAEDLIKMGIEDPRIFEVMGIFEEDFGPDRLSDALMRILIQDFFEFSERITKQLGIGETTMVSFNSRKYILTRHPLEKDKYLVFVPKEILRDLPVAQNYEEIAQAAAFNDELRERFNQFIAPCFELDEGKSPGKERVKEFLFSEKERMNTLMEVYSKCSASHYDFKGDPRGLTKWLEKARSIVEEEPLERFGDLNLNNLNNAVLKVLESFKRAIEIKGIWTSLYKDSKPLNEKHARNIFYAMCLIYFEYSNVDISPESNAGRGPVDFKLSTGKEKIIVEVKLSKGKVKQGYETQTRLYQESEEAFYSHFVVIRVTENNNTIIEIERMSEQEDLIKKRHPKILVIDGRIKTSASNT